MRNRLAEENSLYLRQHASNPVDWYPWGDEAFEVARSADKPVLVSIGYSACHWCHVMAHECFEDDYIAGLMNQHFVCIKVDREERPDVDQVYMEAVQMIQHQGGWPLNVFCLPDGRPFFGGTYFPPEDKGHGIMPWPQLLMRVSDFYKRSKSELEENAEAIQKNILASTRLGAAEAWAADTLVDAAKGICGNHDDELGGFGGAPKFPPAMALNFLAALSGSDAADASLRKRNAEVRRITLRAMAHGGIFDQFGGGFARYSVDAHWLIPHFEKMLYDNALLLDAYTRGWLDLRNPLFKAVVEETVGWLEREMPADCGGFHAALDADSEGGEGAYYVWTPEQVDAVLGPAEARKVRAAYHITKEGNFEHGTSNPALAEPDFAVRGELAPAREKLLAHREAHRPPPGKDTKLNTAWNCMTVRALAEAGFYLERDDWLRRAETAADFLWREVVATAGDGGLRVSSVYYEGGGARVEGFLHDYALAADAFATLGSKVDVLEAGRSKLWLDRARQCLDAALERFHDPRMPGWFFTAEGAPTPVARRKEWFDNATPSGNSAMLHALVKLHAATGEPRYAEAVERALPAFAEYAGKVASGVAHALEAAAHHANGITLIDARDAPALAELRTLLARHPWAPRILRIDAEAAGEGRFRACLGTHCLPPVDSTEELRDALALPNAGAVETSAE